MNRSLVAGLLVGLTLAVPLSGRANPLDNPEQKRLEEQALRLLASKPVKEQIDFVVKSFSADPWASTAEGDATLAASVAEVVFGGAVGAVNQDPARPKVEWLWSPAHSWHGLKVPAAKVLMPNVDNVFRLIPVDTTSHYRAIRSSKAMW